MSGERLLITGAAGTIGRLLTEHWRDRFEVVLTDKVASPPADLPYSRADISDFGAVEQVFSAHPGIHTVVHLAADIRIAAPWESLLPNNVVGTYNVFEAAHGAGCRRVLFASSVNAVDGHPPDLQVTTSLPVAPANLYGASKAWGEALGRLYADRKGMAVHCLRLGWVTPHDGDRLKTEAGDDLLRMAITHRDLVELFERCLASDVHFGIFHGVSDNARKRLDISDTRERTGYAPQDDAFALAGKL